MLSRVKEIVHSVAVINSMVAPIRKLRWKLISRHMKSQEFIFRNLATYLVEDPIIRVEEFNGIFAVDVRSALFTRQIRDGEYEPKLTAACLKYLEPDRDVLDIGANIGFYSVFFAKKLKTGRVLSVEPTGKALGRLKKNLLLNEVSGRVKIFEGVVSDRSGTVEIKTIAGKEEYSSIGEMAHPSIASTKWQTENVASITMADLVEREHLDPGFIKVDTEGVEHLVFRGAKSVLHRFRPIIVSELSDYLLNRNGTSSQEVIRLIQECDYDIYDPIDPKCKPGMKDFGDIICFPKENKVRY